MKAVYAILGIIVSYSCAAASDYFLVGSVNNSLPQRQKMFFLKRGETLKLDVVFDQGNGYIAMIDSFHADGQVFKTSPNKYRNMKISWFEIKPVLTEYSNLWSDGNMEMSNVHVEPIRYEKKPIEHCDNHQTLDFMAALGEAGSGTYYVMAEVESLRANVNPLQPSFFSESAFLSSKFPYKVVQVAYRSDDTYVGFLTELLKTPFIIAPMATTDGYHETNYRIGSDCASFAIYGKRRQGYRVPYCGPRGIYQYLIEIADSKLFPTETLGTEVYVDDKKEFLRIGTDGLSAGDIIHFGDQVSVFYQDSGLIGWLDKNDLIFQSWKDTPHITTITESGFYHKPIRVFKWKN
jgi:hypothetical protein